VINTVTPEGNINVGEELKLLNSNLGNSSLKISNFEITDKYIYKYESCYNEKCEIYKDIINIDYTKNINTLLILDYEYVIDKEVPYYRHSNNVNTFMTNFGKIKYIIEDEEYYLNVNAITPSNLKEKIVLEVSNKIKKAEEIFLTITIRNKEYLIKLK